MISDTEFRVSDVFGGLGRLGSCRDEDLSSCRAYAEDRIGSNELQCIF